MSGCTRLHCIGRATIASGARRAGGSGGRAAPCACGAGLAARAHTARGTATRRAANTAACRAATHRTAAHRTGGAAGQVATKAGVASSTRPTAASRAGRRADAGTGDCAVRCAAACGSAQRGAVLTAAARLITTAVATGECDSAQKPQNVRRRRSRLHTTRLAQRGQGIHDGRQASLWRRGPHAA
jgi:hypothetical protein